MICSIVGTVSKALWGLELLFSSLFCFPHLSIMGGEEFVLPWYSAEVTGCISKTESCVSDGSTDSDKNSQKDKDIWRLESKIREIWYHLFL